MPEMACPLHFQELLVECDADGFDTGADGVILPGEKVTFPLAIRVSPVVQST